jgi:hypothetical protein
MAKNDLRYNLKRGRDTGKKRLSEEQKAYS